ncbi:hypothetical protein Y1Q_0004910 [Alligator mississippiensis]|uniref:Uncharacterized protein n=1 Tax=Alligator mississippiensis TaxID=8496 RepID=A0A151MYB7_ALLMI|nr:hypothetical protein Y1Q_0004910 [Alligator mississippiensis]
MFFFTSHHNIWHSIVDQQLSSSTHSLTVFKGVPNEEMQYENQQRHMGHWLRFTMYRRIHRYCGQMNGSFP